MHEKDVILMFVVSFAKAQDLHAQILKIQDFAKCYRSVDS